ncbi:hypothetical protein [Campylobacter fetus]|uniref:hypothetical protein n=1 Tax=Campylobacter fetus TaxID=196 RepID=UPI00112F7E20|nr:hypothetical protein [Campylobacter fetus]
MPNGLAIKADATIHIYHSRCCKQGDKLVLVSYNPIYTPVRFWQCECKIIGRFVGIFRGV